jgi:diguanylate cyclase (GGDEF)-like protein
MSVPDRVLAMVGPAPLLAVLGALLLLVLALVWQLWRVRRHGLRIGRTLRILREDLALDADPALPGLVGRARFDRALADAADECDLAPGRHSLALLFINLDNFRAVNDTLGFAQGDQVVRQAAQRVLKAMGPGAVATRLGGDEFLLLLRTDQADACALAQRLCGELARPYRVASPSDLGLGCSIGIALYPQHGARARLVGHAATALRAVKLAGGGDYMLFAPQMAVDQRAQAELVADLRHAVARQELALVYQPKVDAASQQITAAEALLRWHHPQHGLISPAVFIPLAERHGLIGPIGNWVIDDACRQAAVWRQQGLRMRVAINISAYQMRQDDLVDRIEAALRRHHLHPGRFTCEITESVAMEDTQVTQRSFERLRRAGVHVAIDDFGVGQASLSYLRRLPARELKIDASFVQDIDTSSDARAIVEAVIQLSHALSLRVVAEGVETAAQRDLLVRLGCDELQGFFFARPMSAAALGTWALLDDGRAAHAPGPGFRDSLFGDTQPAPG